MDKQILDTMQTPLFAQRFEGFAGNTALSVKQEGKHLHTLMSRGTGLEKCTPESVISGMYSVASIGLSLNPALQQCTLVARRVKRGNDWIHEASYMPMYRGLLKLGYATGSVSSFQVENVYERDDFKLGLGSDPKVSHSPSLTGERGPYVGTYVVSKLTRADTNMIEWVSASEMEKIREASDSYRYKWDDNKSGSKKGDVRQSSPWVKWFDEQAKKSALKRAMKRWPQSDNEHWERLSTAIELDNQIERREDDIPGDAVELVSTDQCVAIRDALTEAEKATGTEFGEEMILSLFGLTKLEELAADRYEEVLTRISGRREIILSRKAENA